MPVRLSVCVCLHEAWTQMEAREQNQYQCDLCALNR